MKNVLFALFTWGVLVLTAGAEDLTTLTGQTYSNIVVQSYDRKGLFLDHAGGKVKVYFNEIHPEVRGYYKKMALNLAVDRQVPEEPAGPNDLATIAGPVYRNVVVKWSDAHLIRIIHDTGSATVYFTEIPPGQRERYHRVQAVPDVPPGSNDLMTVDGQVFRHIEIRRVEPDGLTFRHDGGVSKVLFPSLPEEVRQQHGYDPEAARRYQREEARKKALLEEYARHVRQKTHPQEAAVAVPVALSDVATAILPDSKFRVRFTIRNLTHEPQTVRAIPYDRKDSAMMGGKRFTIPAGSGGENLEINVPLLAPRRLTIYCGSYQTNYPLRW